MTIMEYNVVTLLMPPDTLALHLVRAALRHQGNKIEAIHCAGIDNRRPPRGSAAAAILTLLVPLALLFAFWACSWTCVRTRSGTSSCLRLVRASATALASPCIHSKASVLQESKLITASFVGAWVRSCKWPHIGSLLNKIFGDSPTISLRRARHRQTRSEP